MKLNRPWTGIRRLEVKAVDTLPAYERIANAIREEWLSGPGATPGRKLPTLRYLQDRFGVSLPTISRALSVLESEGLIVTRHGSGVLHRGAGPVPGNGGKRGAGGLLSLDRSAAA